MNNSNNTEYHERHLAAFYQQYGNEDVKLETPTQKTQEGGEQREHNQDSGRSRGVYKSHS